MSKKKRLLSILREKLAESTTTKRVVYKVTAYKWIIAAVVMVDSLIVYYAVIAFPYPASLLLGILVVLGSFLLVFYFTALKRIGIIPVSDDLVFILIHLRCLVTGNPPLTTLFGKIGETKFYRKKYSGMFQKLRNLIKNWGYSAPEAIRLISKEAPSKVDEMFLQRLAAIVATGGDIKDYLRIEYNTLFAEYVAAYTRMINILRVVLGIYTTLLAALTFMLANLMLLGMIFGGFTELVMTGITSVGFALMSMAILLYLFMRKPVFESRSKWRSRLLILIILLGLTGFFSFAIMIAYLVISLNIFNMEYVSLSLMLTGFLLLPAAILVKIHESRINEYDMFFPAFIRSYGEQMAVVPNMIESLKPLLIAELGRLKGLLNRVYARLVNRVDPRIAWSLFADESSSEMVTRGTYIFVDTVEVGGDLAEAGALLSDHINEIYRLRANYVQVFKTFEATLYLMHLTTVILLIFVGSFINIFTGVIAGFAGGIPSEYAGLLGIFAVSPINVSLITNISLIVMTIANTLALYSVNPGSRYAIFYYLSIMLIITGLAIYIGYFAMQGLIGRLLAPIS